MDEFDKLASDARAALEAGTLEIEGYEKVEWIKLNPNNPDTFPPRGQYFITYGPGHMNVMFRYSEATETNEEFVNRFFGRYGFTHWRTAPKPPQDETK